MLGTKPKAQVEEKDDHHEDKGEVLGNLVKVVVLIWSASLLTFSYVRLPNGQKILDFDPTFIASVFSGSLAAFGLSPAVYNDNAAGVTALKNQQIDGLVVDLPTAFYLAAVEIPDGIIVGQIEGSDASDQGFGLLLAKSSPITSCVTQAVDAIRSSGELANITSQWLADSAGAPVLQ